MSNRERLDRSLSKKDYPSDRKFKSPAMQGGRQSELDIDEESDGSHSDATELDLPSVS